MFYFLGGSTDITYVNIFEVFPCPLLSQSEHWLNSKGERDYKAIPAGTPKWKGNLPVGHGGTYTQTNGGKFGIAGGYWVDWLLRGNSSASTYFIGPGAQNNSWTVEFSDLDKISVTPIWVSKPRKLKLAFSSITQFQPNFPKVETIPQL